VSRQYLYSLALSALLAVAAVVTVFPLPSMRPNGLGFSSVCPFAPWSTLVIALAAAANCALRKRLWPWESPARAAHPG